MVAERSNSSNSGIDWIVHDLRYICIAGSRPALGDSFSTVRFVFVIKLHLNRERLRSVREASFVGVIEFVICIYR